MADIRRTAIMLKPTFRKIDIDQYNEDSYREEEQAELQSPPVGPDENEVNRLLNQGNNIEALKTVLINAPLGSKDAVVKDNAAMLTQKVLLSFKISQIDEAIAALNIEEIDILMKYIYRSFDFNVQLEKRSAQLLAWHEKAYAVGGVGSIIRVLTEKKKA